MIYGKCTNKFLRGTFTAGGGAVCLRKVAQAPTDNPEDFPPPKPRVISSISVIPLHRQESFLRQKYEAEGLSTGQIAAQIFSAKSTISKYLKEFGVAKKPANPSRKGQLAFGKKVAAGELREKMTEAEVIKAMMRLRAEGYSLRQIAAWLDAKGIKTKNQKGRWQATTIMKILKRMSGR